MSRKASANPRQHYKEGNGAAGDESQDLPTKLSVDKLSDAVKEC
jgi:hypothetical protein